jgi:tyrosyl-tRNA synthetase
MQFGGNDQWSNMLAGTELIRKKEEGADAYAMTITLLLNSEGQKMGKTVGGAVWLDPEKTSPFEFFQYWRNVNDADVTKCLKMLTFLSLDEIAEMEKWPDNRINEKKEILAYELTALVHGKEEAEKAKKVSHSLFGGGGDDADMPTTNLSVDDLTDHEINMMDLMVKCNLVKTKSEARRLIQQNGVSVDNEKISMNTLMISEDRLKDGIVIKKGKKVYHKAIISE